MSDKDLFIALVLASVIAGRRDPVQEAKVLLEDVKQALKDMK